MVPLDVKGSKSMSRDRTDWEAKYRQLNTKAKEVTDRLRNQVNDLYDKNRELSAEVRTLKQERDRAVTDRAIADRVSERMQDLIDGLTARIDRLSDKLVEVASRPAILPDNGELVRNITEGLALVLNGPQLPASADQQTMTQAQLTAAGVRSGEAESTVRLFVPDVEADPWMSNEPTPTPGEWQVGTPSPLTTDQTPSHSILPDGRVVRTDGQPMFQQGAGAAPPTGGTET